MSPLPAYLDSCKIMWIEDRTLIKFHLSKMSFEQSFKLQVRGNAAEGKKKHPLAQWSWSFQPAFTLSHFYTEIWGEVFTSKASPFLAVSRRLTFKKARTSAQHKIKARTKLKVRSQPMGGNVFILQVRKLELWDLPWFILRIHSTAPQAEVPRLNRISGCVWMRRVLS